MSDFRAALVAFERMLDARMKDFRCSVHLCIGQEDVPAALAAHLRPHDWVFSTHRSHGHYLARCVAAGEDFEAAADRLLAEIEGRGNGVNGGYSGSQSFCDPRVRFHSTAIVGGLIGVATGTALAEKIKGEHGRVVCCIGDAATEQGVFWESLNFAVLHALPILYVCENNGLSVHAPLAARQARPLKERVMAFGCGYWKGLGELSHALEFAHLWPAFAEVPCTRECRHVSAMEDLREATA